MRAQQPCASSLVSSLLAAAAALVACLLPQSSSSFMVAGGEPDDTTIGLPNCTTICGNVSVPYPFGFEPGCYLVGFDLTCNATFSPPRLLAWGLYSEVASHMFAVSEISTADSTMEILDPQRMYRGSQAFLNGSVVWHNRSVVFKDRMRWKWRLISGALQGPDETRAGDATCPKDMGAAACHSSHGTCQAIVRSSYQRTFNVSGYVCRCDDGYQGNAYLPQGCQDIDECRLPGKCFGDCINLPGNYSCQCPKGTIGDPYTQYGCEKMHRANTELIIGLGVGTGGTLLFLVVGNTFIIRKIKTLRKKKMRQRFFKQNRGKLLQQLLECQRIDIAERMIVTLEELEKATNNFEKARELGGGGHGTVYKGILSSLLVVAIKKSKIVIQREIDEFINEVAILSQINHRNIVKLIGCCLETEVPLLVYEFISNGALHNHLHIQGSISLPWKERLRIAVETARSLAYIHSLVSMPIIHRDVKSPNILLDDNLTVKLSDFGASRYVPLDQSGLDTTVQGTFGYLDPMYHSTGHLTEKSDVYSFGVVLIELLTRKKPVSYRSPQGHGLVYHFVTLFSEGNLDLILDPQVANEGGGEIVDIALLAKMCVKFTSTDRPTMRQVEMMLESIHAAKEDASSSMTDESYENYIGENDLIVGG